MLSLLALLCLGLLQGCKSATNLGIQEGGEKQEEVIQVSEEGIFSYQPAAQRDMDLLHMDLMLEFDWKKQEVHGKAKLKLTPYFYPQKILRLAAQDFELIRVAQVQGDSSELLGYRYDEQELQVYLPKEVAFGDTVTLEINYIAFPNRNSGEGSTAITDTKGLYFIDPMDTIPGKPTLLWTQGETEHNSKWFPTIDRPNERLTHDIWLTIPDSLVSISNGRLVNQESLGNGMRKDHWEMDLPHAPYLVAIAVGDFAKVTATHGDLPLAYYVEKGFEKGAEKVFASTPDMIDFFEKRSRVHISSFSYKLKKAAENRDKIHKKNFGSKIKSGIEWEG